MVLLCRCGSQAFTRDAGVNLPLPRRQAIQSDDTASVALRYQGLRVFPASDCVNNLFSSTLYLYDSSNWNRTHVLGDAGLLCGVVSGNLKL